MIVSDGYSSTQDRTIALEFVFVQGSPATEWVIQHNMDCHPGVTVVDSGNNQVERRSHL